MTGRGTYKHRATERSGDCTRGGRTRSTYPGIVFKDKRRKVDLLWGDGGKQLVEAVHVVDFVLQS